MPTQSPIISSGIRDNYNRGTAGDFWEAELQRCDYEPIAVSFHRNYPSIAQTKAPAIRVHHHYRNGTVHKRRGIM